MSQEYAQYYFVWLKSYLIINKSNDSKGHKILLFCWPIVLLNKIIFELFVKCLKLSIQDLVRFSSHKSKLYLKFVNYKETSVGKQNWFRGRKVSNSMVMPMWVGIL